MIAAMYAHAVGAFARGELDWEQADIRVLLASDSYQPDQDGDVAVESVGRAQVGSSGTYEQGGAPVADRSVMNAFRSTRLLAGSVGWDDFTGEFRYAVVYDADTGRLVSYTDLGLQRATAARVRLDFAVEGVCVFEVEAA